MKFNLNQAIEVLKNTPAVIKRMFCDLDDVWIHNNYGENTFSPFDVVGHLIHGEREDWMKRVSIILTHGLSKSFESFDRYAMYETSQGKNIRQLLDTFAQLRKSNIHTLLAYNLTIDQLALRSNHPELGTVTMSQLLATWVAHDLNHIAQIAKAMALQYEDQVGPWAAYLSILNRTPK